MVKYYYNITQVSNFKRQVYFSFTDKNNFSGFAILKKNLKVKLVYL